MPLSIISKQYVISKQYNVMEIFKKSLTEGFYQPDRNDFSDE